MGPLSSELEHCSPEGASSYTTGAMPRGSGSCFPKRAHRAPSGLRNSEVLGPTSSVSFGITCLTRVCSLVNADKKKSLQKFFFRTPLLHMAYS